MFYKDCQVLTMLGFAFRYQRRQRQFAITQDQFFPALNLSISEVLALIMAVRQLSSTGDYTLTYDAIAALRKVLSNMPAEVRTAALGPPPRPPGRGRPLPPRPAPLYEAKAVLDALPEDHWQTLTWRAHDDVVLRKQCVALRVHWATGGAQCSPRHARVATGPEGWLLGERPVPGERGEVKWYDSTLPADTPLQRLVELAHSRWPIEQFYADAKGECGLDHYQGRRWEGLHRHLALVMLAYSFLARQRWTSATPAGFSPLWGAPVVSGGPSPGAAVALPRRRALAHRH